MFGSVHVNERGLLLQAGRGGRRGVREAGMAGVDTDSRIAQDGAYVLVAGDQPGSAVVPEANTADRSAVVYVSQSGGRIEGAARVPSYWVVGDLCADAHRAFH